MKLSPKSLKICCLIIAAPVFCLIVQMLNRDLNNNISLTSSQEAPFPIPPTPVQHQPTPPAPPYPPSEAPKLNGFHKARM